MRTIKPILGIALACVSFIAQAEPIKWTTGLSFSEIRKKAKQENKYVFIDCFTTWCTFCKQMDTQAYVDPKVGEFFNDKFISVKVQFDQTAGDSADVKAWYDDAKMLSKQYLIEGYPTFIFLAPDGKPVHKTAGFQSSAQLIELAQVALQPGKTFDNVLERYTAQMDKYKAGEKNYDEYPFMIGIAERTQDEDTAKKLRTELVDYVLTLPRDQRYTKDRLSFWSRSIYASSSRVYDLFTKDGDVIDKAMDQKGFAASFIDKTVQAETVTPFFEEQAKGTGVAVSGMYMSGPGMKANVAEADWKALEKLLTEKYGKDIADRGLYTARIEWYNRHQNKDAGLKWSLLKMKKYPMDIKSEGHLINSFCWGAFITSTDMNSLKECTQWMEKVVAQYPKATSLMDTYAQLLYKTNQKEKAIEWESKAAALEPEDKTYAEVVALMKENRPTYVWGDMAGPMNWDGINHVNWNGFVFQRFVVVKTEDKKPFAGVSVLNKRTKETKTTSEKGGVSMDVSLNDVLVISMPGYKSQEVKVDKKTGYFDVTLKPGN